MGLPGSPGIDWRPRVDGPEFIETVGDAFSDPKLEGFLRGRGVAEVTIVGLDGIACVQRTARGALQRGCETSIFTDAVMTACPERWEVIMSRLQQQGVRCLSGRAPVESR